LPLPVVDRHELSLRGARDRARIEAARRVPLPYLVRAAGDAFRHAGSAESSADATEFRGLERDFQSRILAARKKHGDEALLALRAIQTSLFVEALERWARTGRPDADLAELGGAFVDRAKRNRWLDGERRLAFDDDALAELFAVRWSSMAGVVGSFPFTPSLDEWRLYYRTLIEHPERRVNSTDPLDQTPALAGYVEALERHDPDYPILLARGILQLREGHAEAARALLARHLEKNPGGPWRLRAENYLADAFRPPAAR
jgi:hypothetical protein